MYGEKLDEGVLDRGDAEADVLRRADSEDGDADEDASGDGAQRGVRDELFRERGDAVGKFREAHGGEAEGDAREHGPGDAGEGHRGDI